MKETDKRFLKAVKEAKQRLAAGEKPEDVFDWRGDFHDGFAAVVLNDKDNYINIDGELLSTTWFDLCEDFHEGFAVVELDNKCNFIGSNGNILSDMWFNDCERFNGHFARVELNGKDYYIRKDGVLCDYDTKEPVVEKPVTEEPDRLVSLNKACEWLKDRTMKELCLPSTDSELVDEFIETFREAMEE